MNDCQAFIVSGPFWLESSLVPGLIHISAHSCALLLQGNSVFHNYGKVVLTGHKGQDQLSVVKVVL